MNESSHRMNLHHRQDHKTEISQETRQASDVLEFQSAEEMIRHDAAQIEVPESIAEHVAASAHEATPLPWWKRLFRQGSS